MRCRRRTTRFRRSGAPVRYGWARAGLLGLCGMGYFSTASLRPQRARRWRRAPTHVISLEVSDRRFRRRDAALDEKRSDHIKSVPLSLKSALRRARVESAEQSEAVAELREAEIARLEILEEAVRPIVEQTPGDADLFDLGISQGERPRLFIDMIGFVEMAHDRRVYRFCQDTRHGRATIAESERVDRMVAAITNYVARRLVERERALASDWRSRGGNVTPGDAKHGLERSVAESEDAKSMTPSETGPQQMRRRRSRETFRTFLAMVGALSLCGGVAYGAFQGWRLYGRALWELYLGLPPF
jgi:hypothetical protein